MTIHYTKEDVWKTVQDFVCLETETARKKYQLGKDARDWKVNFAQEDLKAGQGLSKGNIKPILYRPFDVRYTYYTGKSRGFIFMPRPDVMGHMQAGPNLAILVSRQVLSEFRHIFVSNVITNFNNIDVAGRFGSGVHFPLYIYKNNLNFKDKSDFDRQPNLSSQFAKLLAATYKYRPIPEEIFYYIYSILYSPAYRTRYVEFLKIDLPRLPLTSNLDLFRALSQLGSELVALHLMESPKLDQHLTTYTGNPVPVVDKVSWANDTVWLDKAQKNGYIGVSESVWNFHIGGALVHKCPLGCQSD